jgi:hypothetical protein
LKPKQLAKNIKNNIKNKQLFKFFIGFDKAKTLLVFLYFYLIFLSETFQKSTKIVLKNRLKYNH